MSLRSRPRHVVSVQKMRSETGSVGQLERVKDGRPVNVRGTLHPLDATEIQFYGDRGTETRKFFCNVWPGGMNAVVTFEGATWDQVEPVESHRIGQMTKHVEVILRRRASNG
jgi:hypothetical protein